MRKVLKIAGKVVKCIGKGVIDTILPNIKHSIKMNNGDIPDRKPKLEIDFVRLITAITVWILLFLVFTGKVKFSDVLELISKLLLFK